MLELEIGKVVKGTSKGCDNLSLTMLIVSSYLCVSFDAMEGVSERVDCSSEDEDATFSLFENELNIVQEGEIDNNEEGKHVGILLPSIQAKPIDKCSRLSRLERMFGGDPP